MTARLRDDSGQITILAIGYCVIAIALLFVVASASAVHLERKRLLEVADAAALDAADALDSDVYYGQGSGGVGSAGVPLTDASVRASVADYLEIRGAAGEFESLTVVDPTGTPDGATAEVTLTTVVTPPLVGAVLTPFGGGIVLHATARARTDVTP